MASLTRKPSPVDHEQKRVVANAVAALLCRLKQAIDLRRPFRKFFERS
jgi:hypothetical protein